MALRPNRVNTFSYQSGVFAGDNSIYFRRVDLLRNMYAGQGGIDDKSGMPSGYNTGGIVLPLKAGGMSSYNPAILNLVKSSADAKLGRNMIASAAMVLTKTNAQADQIVSLEGDAALALTKTNAALTSAVSAVADSTMTITPSASLGGIIPVTADATMAITPNADMTALASMEADAGGPTPLSPGGLTQTLLDESDIENGYSMREALRLILSSTAGKLSGAGTATITIRSVTDGTNRIVATVDSNGNRSAVTYDVGDE